ncbi:thymidylate synthase [Aureimonas sp. N4]|uniref:thymidylate synthase n=1 Tax=Aureimonas sp. N4 TaxID=1638165 RepID=UPI000B179C3E|nr:thymidylate synthase [Aureimonas sp. N4]
MTDFPKVHSVSGDNVSFVWAEIACALLQPGRTKISPLTVTIEDVGGDAIAEDGEIRAQADKIIEAVDGQSVETAAWTIFPQRHWSIMQNDRSAFLEEAIEAVGRAQEMNRKHNGRGTYFQRLVDFDGDGKGPNQLERLLSKHDSHPTARQSMWQMSTFDPHRDHSDSAQLQFPCLQQISVSFTSDQRVVLHAFYATQQIAARGYGNYLGLMQLGRFLGSQMTINDVARGFAGISVYVGTAKAENIKKSDPTLADLPALLEERLALSNHRVHSTLAEERASSKRI